jgi:hypothetical protein
MPGVSCSKCAKRSGWLLTIPAFVLRSELNLDVTFGVCGGKVIMSPLSKVKMSS